MYFISRNVRIKGITYAFLSLLLLGIMPIITNSRPNSFPVLEFAFYLSFWQMIFSIPMLFVEFQHGKQGLFSQNDFNSDKRMIYSILFITGALFALSTFLYVYFFAKAGTINTAIALQSYPVITLGIEYLVLKKSKPMSQIIFTLLLIIGLYYLSTSGTFLLQGISIWIFLTLLVPIIWSIAHITIRETISSKYVTANQITFVRVSISTLLIGIVFLITDTPNNLILGIFNFKNQLYAVSMGLAYYLELLAWFNSIKHIDVSLASTITTPSPVLTTIIAVIFLSERLYLYQIIALGIILISLYGVLFFNRKEYAFNSSDKYNVKPTHDIHREGNLFAESLND